MNKRLSQTLLVEMQNGITSLEGNYLKGKVCYPSYLPIPSLGVYLPEGLSQVNQRNIFEVFNVALSVTEKNWQQPKCPRDQLIKLWCNHSTDLGWGLITVGHICHVKESGFYPEDNGKTLTDIKQGNDTIGLTC